MSSAPLRPLSTGEILDVAFSLYRRHFVVLAIIAIVSQTIGLVVAIYAQFAGGMLENFALTLISMLVSSLCTAIGMGASTKIVADSYLGKQGSAAEALAWVLPHTLKLVGLTMLGGLAVGFGIFLLVIPGIMIGCGIAVSASALVVEGLSPMDALNRSWNLTRGDRWRVFGVVVVALLVIYLTTIAAGVLAALAGFASSAILGVILLVIVSAVLTVLVYPFVYCAITVLYYDLRVRKEGFDLEVLESQLAHS